MKIKVTKDFLLTNPMALFNTKDYKVNDILEVNKNTLGIQTFYTIGSEEKLEIIPIENAVVLMEK